jgi:predicted GNAT family acetyltransferase
VNNPTPSSDQTTVQVVRNDAAHRYEARVDDQVVGFVDFRQDMPGITVAVHTQTDPTMAGRGIGSALARGVLDDLRDRGEKVKPVCPFIREYLARHGEYADLVA